METVASVDYCPVAQMYEDESLYENMKSGNVAITSYLRTDNMCAGVLTLTSGSTMRGWFSPDLHTRWLGELTKWSQVNYAVRERMDLMDLTILTILYMFQGELRVQGQWRRGRLEGRAYTDNQYGG